MNKKWIFTACFLGFIALNAQKVDNASKRAARNYLRDGNHLFKKKKYDEAAVAYRKALDENPDYNKASRNLGAALFLDKNYKSAQPHYEKVLSKAKTKQEKAIAYHDLGTNLLAQGQFEKAIKNYKKALRNNPFAEDTRYNLAFAQKMLKKSGGGGGNGDEKNKNNQKEKSKNNSKRKNGNKKQKAGQDDKKKNPKNKQKQNVKMTKQQMKQLLEAIKNQEEKTRKKVQKKKIKAPKKKQEKDW